jgi:hypothetical protein
MSREPKLISRERVAERARVICGIGHIGRADVFTATLQYTDMDGDPLPPFTSNEYEPPTCVTCGLCIWQRVPPQ